MDEQLLKDIKESWAPLEKWLEENVEVIPDPQAVHLSDFEVSDSGWKGSFSVAFDQYAFTERLSFSANGLGKTTLYLPMYHSPLGARGSYCAIDISSKTQEAIHMGIHKAFPDFAQLALNSTAADTTPTPHTKESAAKRIAEVRSVLNQLSAGFSVTVNLSDA